MTDKEVMQQALEFLEEIAAHCDQHSHVAKKGAELLCTALAQSPAIQAEPVAWEWRKRMSGGMYEGSPYMVWSEWEPLVPPYMDARGFSKTDPENYEIRPLFLSANNTP